MCFDAISNLTIVIALSDVIERFEIVSWLLWLTTPVAITFLLPLVILLLVYGCVLFLHFYKSRHKLVDAYSKGYWDAAKVSIATFWEVQGKIWHGYEIRGLEKLPTDSGAVLVFYHGAIPIDFYYILSKVVLYKENTMHIIGDRFLFKVPGFKLLMQVFNVTVGSWEECTDMLKKGHLLAISPGGVREAFFSNEYYQLKWKNRIGFAKCAVSAQVPIIPIFTQNCREAFRALSFGRPIFKWLYEKTRLPIVPIYGGFPVKLRTFIGDPIVCKAGTTAEQLALECRNALEQLIVEHQKIPGSILHALFERF
ncbi:DGAT1/2-independent enzyme synthesizing storage lipids-like [Antedon mediterranea]|uniref:DGAT1/2-independent enzyme synthesizing storage lipids-like n=1 Tax=Antedon mediterranea TaxID=105859 RepID=UPI003AF7D91A